VKTPLNLSEQCDHLGQSGYIIGMSDDLLSEQLPALRKPNEVLVMISKEKGLTAVARKLYTVLLWETQQQMKALGKVPEATHLFELPLRRALFLAGSSTESRTLAQGYLREMRKMSITWEAPGTTNGHEWTDMSLLSQASFEMKNGERYVQWALPPDLVKALIDPKLWTLQDLPILATLESYAAIALYDVCSRYKNNPSGVTNRAAPDWWVSALSSSAKKREWRKVKNESVADAIREINEKTDIEVGLLEHRQGRAVTEIQFSVKKKRTAVSTTPDDLAARIGPRLIGAAEGMNISMPQLDGLLKKFSEERLLMALAQLRQRLGMPGTSPVRNHMMYLTSILDPAAPDPIRPPELVPSQPVRKVQMVVETSEAGRRDRFDATVAQIALMNPDERHVLLQELSVDLRTKGLLTPSVAKRLREGDWTSPLLKVELVKLLESKAPLDGH
jgi:hypothetical protein